MFPTRESRLRSALRRSLDAAIEFATLGEYGWSAAVEAPGGAGSTGSPASAEAPVTARPEGQRPGVLLRPASAAGRARRNAQAREAARCGGQPLRGRALESHLPRTSRSRDGMAPRDPRCLADAAA